MKDIHSHLLFGIDDGAKTIEESIKLLEDLAKRGVTDIVLTPHYIIDSRYSCNPKKKRELLKQINTELNKKNIAIKLYLGNEIFLDDRILEYLNKKEIDTINDSKYVLIEFSLYVFPKNALNIFSELIYNGYKVILAHPERYSYMYDNMEFFDELKQMGVLFQANYNSLFNKYGSYAKKNLKYLFKNNYVDLLASDIHHSTHLDLKKLRHKIKKYVNDENQIDNLLTYNFDKVINNKDF